MNALEYISDQLSRIYDGPAWHGDSIAQILDGIDAAKAFDRPLQNAHTIWEIVVHIVAWDRVALASLQGAECRSLQGEEDWPPVKSPDPAAWEATLKDLGDTTALLEKVMEFFSETKLHERIPGKEFSFYTLMQGVIHHNVYHMGQIAILKK